MLIVRDLLMLLTPIIIPGSLLSALTGSGGFALMGQIPWSGFRNTWLLAWMGQVLDVIGLSMASTGREVRQDANHGARVEQDRALVREVHHRIKNNLQGMTGLLHQFGCAHPETMVAMSLVIGQVRSIAVIHGLLGQRADLVVRLCELTSAIADELSQVWHVPVRVDVPAGWVPCALSDDEALPMALVLSELITNAAKHGAPDGAGVDVRLQADERTGQVLICIRNRGTWPPSAGVDVADAAGRPRRCGLDLVDSLLPPRGARVEHRSEEGYVHATLTVTPPIIRTT